MTEKDGVRRTDTLLSNKKGETDDGQDIRHERKQNRTEKILTMSGMCIVKEQKRYEEGKRIDTDKNQKNKKKNKQKTTLKNNRTQDR